MRQWATVTRLAIHELWITFRLLLALVAFVAAGAVAALIPAPPTVALSRLGLGLGVATAVAAAIAAWSLGAERTTGRAGWLVTRTVSRGTYLLGWYAALAIVATAGLAAAAALGWLSIASAAVGASRGAYVASNAAIGTGVLVAVALGLVAGCVLPRVPAALAAASITASGIFAGAVGAAPLPLPLGTAVRLLPEAATSSAALPATLRATGVGLVTAAVLLVLARILIERAEL